MVVIANLGCWETDTAKEEEGAYIFWMKQVPVHQMSVYSCRSNCYFLEG
jgi:hypothetical protein